MRGIGQLMGFILFILPLTAINMVYWMITGKNLPWLGDGPSNFRKWMD